MTYSKPEITEIGTAASTIQGVPNGKGIDVGANFSSDCELDD